MLVETHVTQKQELISLIAAIYYKSLIHPQSIAKE